VRSRTPKKVDENKLLIDEREMLARTHKMSQKEQDRELVNRLAEHDINNLVAERQREAQIKSVLREELMQQMHPVAYVYPLLDLEMITGPK
jgi:adenylosuccinate lyase